MSGLAKGWCVTRLSDVADIGLGKMLDRPLTEQQEIVRRVEALFKTADALEARYRKAKAHVDKLTQSILAKAFRGELVPQDPNDEPASLLLKKIRADREVEIDNDRRRRTKKPSGF
jgi:type I restriction enzyme, S subunit